MEKLLMREVIVLAFLLMRLAIMDVVVECMV